MSDIVVSGMKTQNKSFEQIIRIDTAFICID